MLKKKVFYFAYFVMVIAWRPCRSTLMNIFLLPKKDIPPFPDEEEHFDENAHADLA